MNDEFYHLVPDSVVMRMLGQRQKMRCMCCKEWYERGRFTCCAPPNGMRTDKWMSLTCPDPPRGCGKCIRHCECESKKERLGKGPLASLAQAFLAEYGR